MAFIRVKRIGGREYAYLVESRWDAARKASRQVTVKYLGAVDRLRSEDVPRDHRTEAVEAFVLRHSAASQERRERIAGAFGRDLGAALTEGNRRKATDTAKEAVATLGLDAFYVDVLTAVLHEIGDRWRRQEISIAVEHLASNLASQIVDEANAGLRTAPHRKGTVALCTPPGEQHQLATKVLEGLLLQRGHAVYNLSASAPVESLVGYLESRKPDAVLVSVTVPAHLAAAKRLVRAVRDRLPSARVLVGGQGIRDGGTDGFPHGTAFGDSTLVVLDSLGRPSD